jgi:hypothetical protein
VINTTRLLRRIERYLADNGGGKRQTGVYAFCREADVYGMFVAQLRKGASVGEIFLKRADDFLTARGY